MQNQGGAVFDKGTCFECPLHGWQFDRATGRCLNAPSRALASIPVTLEDVAQVAAVKVLFGEKPFVGKLPVSIPGLFEIGAGITR